MYILLWIMFTCSLFYGGYSSNTTLHDEKRFLLEHADSTRNFLTCMYCRGVDNPEACTQEISCATGQFCYLDKIFEYDFKGRTIYNAGCRSTAICHLQTCLSGDDISKREIDDYHDHEDDYRSRRAVSLLKCSKCCRKDRCNKKLCGFSQEQSAPLCYYCSNIDNPKKCQHEKYCEDTQVCSVTVYAKILTNNQVARIYEQGCVSNYTCTNFQENSITTTAATTKVTKTTTKATTTDQGVEILPPSVGRRYLDRSRRFIQIGFGCCKGDLCNKYDPFLDDGNLEEIILPDGYTCPSKTTPQPTPTSSLNATTNATSIPQTSSTEKPSSVGTTMQPTTSVTKPSTSKPLQPTSCYLCTGPSFLCEQINSARRCSTVDQQYCINDIVQNFDGSRTIKRRCATQQECESEWWQQTSDRVECSSYDPNVFISRQQFACTFCCRSSLCNKNVVPDDLYVGTESQGKK